jgi:hypothetical protein
MNFPVGVAVSILSFWLINSTPFAVSLSIKLSKSRVFRAKRLTDSTITVSPHFTTLNSFCNPGRAVFFPLSLSE